MGGLSTTTTLNIYDCLSSVMNGKVVETKKMKEFLQTFFFFFHALMIKLGFRYGIYRVFHQFRQDKFVYLGTILSSNIDHGKSDELGSGPNWKKWPVLKG